MTKARFQETVSQSSEETKLKAVGINVTVGTSETSVTLPVITSGKGAPTPSIRDSQITDTSGDVAWQSEQGRLDVLRTAATLRRTSEHVDTSMAPSQVVVTATSAVVGGLALEGSEIAMSPKTSTIRLYFALC